MLDTIRVAIPLSANQYKRIRKIAAAEDRWQWVLLNEHLGELRFRRISGLATTDQHSYHRELRWDIPSKYEEDCRLTLEFSLPKFWYGHNIHLLYGFVEALEQLRQLLHKQFKFARSGLPEVMDWEVKRVDYCYSWRFPTQATAQAYLDSLKRIAFPRKKPIIYPTAILFAGATYSLKFYLKLPEFRNHDLRELVKSGANLDWVNSLEEKAKGILRVEATLRSKYLKRQEIQTISNLIEPIRTVEWDSDVVDSPDFDPVVFLGLLAAYQQVTQSQPGDTPLYDGLRLEAPAMTFELGDRRWKHPGGGASIKTVDRGVRILQSLLTKFLGGEVGMQSFDVVEQKLLSEYKPVKAARLAAFWLYVQRVGSKVAREAYGKDSYYYSRRELKKAGVSLIEPPSNVIELDPDFFRNFKLEVPSYYVTNRVDDFRDSDNILNFVPKASNN